LRLALGKIDAGQVEADGEVLVGGFDFAREDEAQDRVGGDGQEMADHFVLGVAYDQQRLILHLFALCDGADLLRMRPGDRQNEDFVAVFLKEIGIFRIGTAQGVLAAAAEFVFGLFERRGGRQIYHDGRILADRLHPGTFLLNGVNLIKGPLVGSLRLPKGLAKEKKQGDEGVRHTSTMAAIRRGRRDDLPRIAEIQEVSAEASHWRVEDYLGYGLWVAEESGTIAGFLVWREVGPEEGEILNLAVAPEWRRRGIARALIQTFLGETSGVIFLELRESNLAGLNLYKSMGFQEVSRRAEYYDFPPEAAIVMKFHSC